MFYHIFKDHQVKAKPNIAYHNEPCCNQILQKRGKQQESVNGKISIGNSCKTVENDSLGD